MQKLMTFQIQTDTPSDEYLLKPEREEVKRDLSRPSSAMSKILDYTMQHGDHRYSSKISRPDEKKSLFQTECDDQDEVQDFASDRQSKPENIHRTDKLGYTKPSIRLNVEENIDSRDYSRHQATQHQNPQLGWQQGPNENIENRDYFTIPSPEIQHRIRIPSPEIRRRIPLPEIQRRIPSPEIFREPVYSLRTPNPAYSSTMNRNMYTPRPFLSYHESPQLMPPAKPKSKNLRNTKRTESMMVHQVGKLFTPKFQRYADRLSWTTTERKDQLCWCLHGKAGDYYANLIDRDQGVDYFDVIHKLEKRFNFQDLPETLQVQFMSARQNANEKLEDWADRVLSLACKAFRDLPDNYMYTQAIWKICQGCSDKEAGQHGATARPTSVEAAIDQIKWFQHNHTAIFGKPTGRRDPTPNQDEPSYDYDSDLAVHAIGKTDTKSELSKQMETLLEKMTAMEALHKQEIGDLKQQFQKTTAGKTVPCTE
ncbi:Hypothetical predicted protein [Mytilus galloprovincialis]|uniref:Retrotransposon gag domain-containing protein n=1 Tax=Mytilus galloprovincialis TaxID=29158 RepID=A0A8B6F1N1_MYTGA|nr:Hypothetical predicted protein [Mytilus galloprovincialis]